MALRGEGAEPEAERAVQALSSGLNRCRSFLRSEAGRDEHTKKNFFVSINIGTSAATSGGRDDKTEPCRDNCFIFSQMPCDGTDAGMRQLIASRHM
jgi:hypothetical protein